MYFFPADAVVVAALGEDVPRGWKRRVRRRIRLPTAISAAAAATRTATPSARLRSLVQTGDTIRSHGGAIPFLSYFTLARMVRVTFHKFYMHFYVKFKRTSVSNMSRWLIILEKKQTCNNYVIFSTFTKGENDILAARGGDVRGASRARRSHERHRGGDGSARRSRSSARGPSARGASALDRACRGRAVLRAKRDDVLLALRQRRLSACVVWFV